MMKTVSRIFMYIFISVAAFISVFPLIWTVTSATNRSVDIVQGRIMPGNYLLENINSLMSLNDNIMTAFLNSTRNTLVLTALSIVVCSLAGYGFEIFHSKGKDRLMSVLLLSMMIPFAATMIPLFIHFGNQGLGLLNTTLGFVLPSISSAFFILLFRQSARSFPHDMIEAARIDGLSELGIFVRMFVPTMRATFAAALVITFMNGWNAYIWPRIIFRGDPTKVTLPLLISNLTSGYVTDYGVIMLAVLIATIPTIVIFFILQRYFAEGIAGTVK